MGNASSRKTAHTFTYLGVTNNVALAEQAICLHDMWYFLFTLAGTKEADARTLADMVEASHDDLERAGARDFGKTQHGVWLPLSLAVPFLREHYASSPAILALIDTFPMADLKHVVAQSWLNRVTAVRAKVAAKLVKLDATLAEIKARHPSMVATPAKEADKSQ